LAALGPISASLRPAAQGPDHGRCQKATGIKLDVETINANDIPGAHYFVDPSARPRYLHDPQQLAATLCSELRRVLATSRRTRQAQGGFYDICKVVSTVDGK